MAQLIVIKGPDMGKTFELARSCHVGRAEGSEVRLSDDGIAPDQALIWQSGSEYRLEVFSEAGHIKVNGAPISKEGALQHGDLISVGNTLLLFDDEKDAFAESGSRVLSTSDLIDSQIQSRQSYYRDAERVLNSFESEDPVRTQKRLATLYKVANAISGILSLDDLLHRLLDILFEEFPADRGYIMLMDRAERKLHPMATRVRNGLAEETNPRISRTIVKEVFKTKDSILSKNAMADERFNLGESVIGQKIQAAMCVPLVYKDTILGLIALDSQRYTGVFTEADLDQLTKIATQAAVLIENVRVYEQNREFSRNLLQLSKATHILSSYLDPESILSETASFCCNIFGCTKSSILLVSEDGKEIRMAYSVGIDRGEWPAIRIGIGSGIVGRVIERKEPLLVKHVRSLPEDIPFKKNPKYDSTSFLVGPIVASGKGEGAGLESIGAICVTDKLGGGVFTREDQEILAILASHAAIALVNARLYQELKEQEKEINRWNRELERRVEERTRALKDAQDQLTQSEKMAAIGLLAAGVSHEFNNLITSMYGFAQMAQTNEKFKDKLVDIVIEQSQRAREITEGLLSFSRQRVDAYELCDVTETVEKVISLTAKALENESIELVRRFQPAPRTVLSPGKIQQVFLNVIINARHAIEHGGTITIEVLRDGTWVLVRFTDTGKGIAPENLHRIFEPFFTTKGSFGGSSTPGTGIGLSVCYNIVKEHGGEILVASELGKGSTFTIKLPIRENAPATREDRPTPTPHRRIDAAKRILVVDDDEPIRDILAAILQNRCETVETAASGAEAIKKCRAEGFDTVFLDIKMPGRFDGFRTYEELKRMDKKIRVVFITGRDEDTRLRRYAEHAEGYVRKPFKIEEIYRLLGVEDAVK
ncbi:MAG: GAF domain-containing protein [Planctomycetes bacterium]|nr:GAF domain-containing protein [Planctomycetota bacterium]